VRIDSFFWSICAEDQPYARCIINMRVMDERGDEWERQVTRIIDQDRVYDWIKGT